MRALVAQLAANQGSNVMNILTQPSQPHHAPPHVPSATGSHTPTEDPNHDLSRLYVDLDKFVGWGTLYPDRATFHNVAVPKDVVVVQVRHVCLYVYVYVYLCICICILL